MKVRLGYVSNSSSSSFIVQIKPTYFDIHFNKNLNAETSQLIANDKIEKLIKCGFVYTPNPNPFFHENRMGACLVKNLNNEKFLGLYVSCNEIFVLQFLVANDIPFNAATHYGHYYYTYNPEENIVYKFSNFGLKYFMYKNYKNDKNSDYVDFEPVKEINKKEFLKDYDEEESIQIMTGKY